MPKNYSGGSQRFEKDLSAAHIDSARATALLETIENSQEACFYWQI